MIELVGLCGAHGTGKSTILQAVKELGYQVDETQLSRTAQKALGWSSLAEAQKSEDHMWALQDAVLEAMYDRDQRILESKIPTLVDRTPADVWGYLCLWVKRLNEEVDWDRVSFYKQQCRDMAARYSRHIIVPIREEIKFVTESNRADEESREFLAQNIEDFVVRGGLEYSIIQTVAIDYRVIEVIERMK